MENEVTPEQKKEVAKILSKARWNLLFIGAKFGIGLFFSNLIAMIIGIEFLKDADPDLLPYFQFVAMVTNFIFMALYLDRQFKKNSDIVKNQVKEVLKK